MEQGKQYRDKKADQSGGERRGGAGGKAGGYKQRKSTGQKKFNLPTKQGKPESEARGGGLEQRGKR